MTSQQLARLKLPDSPGVYIFRNYRKRPLYIGRATSLADRTKSYFSADLIETRGPRIVDMVTKAKSLTWQIADSVLEAVILESALIKRYQPHYNVDERDDKSSQYVIITDEDWPRVFLARVRDFDQLVKDGKLSYSVREKFGPYPNSGLIKEALRILRKLFPFRDRKALDPRHNEFYRALGRSPRDDDDSAYQRYLRTIEYLTLFFKGRKAKLRSSIKKQMDLAAKDLRFEEASQAKRLLYALDHINDMALIKADRPGSIRQIRIEAYDVAHLGGMNVVGAMVASVNGSNTPSEYRKFKISRQANDDIAGLREILSRRLNHSEWTYPDLIVVDGAEPHLRAAEAVLQARRITIPVVAVTKDDRHKAANIVGDSQLISRMKGDIISINAEAHRFAIAFHRLRRRKMSMLH